MDVTQYIENYFTIGTWIASSCLTPMDVKELAALSELQMILDPGPVRAEVVRVSASDTMSDLIANAGRDTLLVTSLNNSQLIRVAELMDAPGICLVGGTPPCDQLLASARRAGTAILVSAAGLEATRLRLERALSGPEAPHP